MAVNTVDYAANLQANTSRGPSGVIWADCPIGDLNQSPENGMMVWDDFMSVGAVDASGGVVAGQVAGLAGWSAYLYQGSTILDGQAEGGVIKVGADGDNEGCAFLSNAGSFRMVTTSTLALNRKMWFECRFARSSITTDVADYFIGLMAPTLTAGLPVAAQPITATDDTLMTAGSFFGFHSNSNTGTRGGPTEIAVAFELASGTINYPTNLTTLMASSGNSVLTAGGFVKVGFVFDPDAPSAYVTTPTARQTAGQLKKKLIRFFVNGLELPTFLTSDDVQNATAGQAFPTSFMAPCFAIMNTSAGTPTLNMDWIRCVQLANS